MTLAKEVASVIREHVGKAFRALAERIDGVEHRAAERIQAVERRLEAVEVAQKNTRYRGVWQRADVYYKGNRVTFDGCLWEAVSDTPGKPGIGSGWQLAERRGADAR